jgi:hypothetical protein
MPDPTDADAMVERLTARIAEAFDMPPALLDMSHWHALADAQRAEFADALRATADAIDPPGSRSGLLGETDLFLTESARSVLCARCGHRNDWHRHDDSSPPLVNGHNSHGADTTGEEANCPCRCIGYDCRIDYSDPPELPCNCPDFVPPIEETPHA